MKQQPQENVVFGTYFDVSGQVAHLPICLEPILGVVQNVTMKDSLPEESALAANNLSEFESQQLASLRNEDCFQLLPTARLSAARDLQHLVGMRFPPLANQMSNSRHGSEECWNLARGFESYS
jgi:hypothetical protein